MNTIYDLYLRPDMILLGPGPKDLTGNVLACQALPMQGHLIPPFQQFIDKELLPLLALIFGAEKKNCFPISGTGSTAQECCVWNLLGLDWGKMVVANDSAFAVRMAKTAERIGVEVFRATPDSRRASTPEEILAQLKAAQKTRRANEPLVLGVVAGKTDHGFTSDIPAIIQVAREFDDCLVLIDVVSYIGGHVVDLKQWDADAVFFGGQKATGGVPCTGAAAFSRRAMEHIMNRPEDKPCISWQWDVRDMAKYWQPGGDKRIYTTTANTIGLIAMAQGLANLEEEGLLQAEERHHNSMQLLHNGLCEMGLKDGPMPANQLNTLTTVPLGNRAAVIQKILWEDHSIEVAGGVGVYAGKEIRVGPMATVSHKNTVNYFLKVLSQVMSKF